MDKIKAAALFEDENILVVYGTTDGEVFTDVHEAVSHAVELSPGNPEVQNITPQDLVETYDHVVTEDDIKNDPALAAAGIKAGDTIQIPINK